MMKTKGKAISPRWMYLALLPVSLLIPVMHFLLIDKVLEHHRYPWGMMPSHFLFLRWFGELARGGPIILLGLFAFSWKYKGLNEPVAMARVSTLFYVLTVLYAGYGCLLNWMALAQ